MIAVAVIGCGYWGKNLIRNFAELGALNAVSDSSLDKANSFANNHNVRSLTVDQILDDSSIDAVVIASAPQFNPDLSRQAIQKGKHVFVEKPYATTNEDSLSLERLLKEKPVTFMVGHLLLYHPAYIRVRELLQAGEIGDLQEIRCVRHGLGRIRLEFGVLWELAPHDVSMILDLNPGVVTHIEGFGASHVQKQGDTLKVQYRFDNHVTAQISCSWVEPAKQQQLTLQGSHGFIVFDDTKGWDEKVTLTTFKDGVSQSTINSGQFIQKKIPLSQEEVLKRECSHFLDCIRQNIPSITGLSQAKPVLDLLIRTELS